MIFSTGRDILQAELKGEGGLSRALLEDPEWSNRQWQRDLLISNERIGDRTLRAGDEAGAKVAFQKALDAYEALLKSEKALLDKDPDDEERLLSVVPHWRLATLERENAPDKARTHLQAALAVLEPLAAADHLDAMRRAWIDQIKAQLAALDARATTPPVAPPAKRKR